MPEEEYVWIPRDELLNFEEISRLVDVFARLGVSKVRLTGGEPLLRRDLPDLIQMISSKPSLDDLALTTNATTLSAHVDLLKRAGLGRLTISLDTLRPDRFHSLTRRDAFDHVISGIESACEAGFSDTKVNMVVMKGVNDDELIDMIEFSRRMGCEIRFIEYMDVGGATGWRASQVVSKKEILATLAENYGSIEEIPRHDSAPAEQFRLLNGQRFGIISSTTDPFCGSCDRARLTADGYWYLCLYAVNGFDLKTPLRSGASDAELAAIISEHWQSRENRGAERRLATPQRSTFVPVESLKRDHHLEMHTRGG
jgi:cyclic pyranopterin phosphate synthase